jgi:hypothetical protein
MENVLDPRARRAIDVVISNAWQAFTDADGRRSWRVPSQRVRGRFYRVTDNSCSCPDQTYRPWATCKHVLAVRAALALGLDPVR